MNELTEVNWHELTEEEVVRMLDSDPACGLTSARVEARLAQFGRNEITGQRRRSEWTRLLSQFAQALMYILLLASAVTLLLGEYVDSAVIFCVTLINGLAGFFQKMVSNRLALGFRSPRARYPRGAR